MTLDFRTRAAWLAKHVLPHEAGLRRWLGQYNSAGCDIDDIIQETYAKLMRIDSVEHIMEVRAYLFRVAASLALQEIRRSRVVPIAAGADWQALEVAASEPLADAQLEARQELESVIHAITALPPQCRQAFLLRKVQGLSQREIAARMSISESTVEKHISRGLQMLLRTFGRGGRTAPDASSLSTNERTDRVGRHYGTARDEP
jgi:RNA polymerase sigma-70 factor (ECF subfamily)